MSEPFDPYYIWLGIPPEDQPPNHYRLLGITLFEANRDVIEAAANRQMNYLQEISSGEEHINEAQQLLGELSRARICLLNEEKKAAYDEQFRSEPSTSGTDSVAEEAELKLQGETPGPTPFIDVPPEPPAFPGLAGGSERPAVPLPDGLGASQPAPTRPRKKKQKLVPIIGLTIAVLVLFGGGLTLYFSSQAQQREKDRKEAIAKKQEEFDRDAKEEAERIKAKKEAGREKEKKADRRLIEEERRANDAETKLKQEAERKAKEEVELKAKEEADRKAKEEADRTAKEEADRKAKEEADRKAKEEADRKAKEEADRKAQERAAAAEAKRKAEEKAAADKSVLSKYDLQFADGFWEPTKQWAAYRDFSRQLGLLKQGKPIPKQNDLATIDRVRKEYEAKLAQEVNDSVKKYNAGINNGIITLGFPDGATQQHFYKQLSLTDAVDLMRPKASKAERDAAFYEWAFKLPQFKSFFVIPTPVLIAKYENKLSTAANKIKAKNKILRKNTEVKAALESLGQTLRPAP